MICMEKAMDYEIIFYHSGRTAEIERLLEKRLEALDLSRRISAAAADPEELSEMLRKSMSGCELIFVVGGLDNSKKSTDNVISSVLSSEKGLSSERLIDDDENTAYLIRSEKQLIAVIPDDTEVIEKMLEKKIVSRIKSVFSVSEQNDEKPSINEIKEELDRQLSELGRTRTSVQSQGDDKIKDEKDILLYLSVSLGIVSALLLITALILYFM